MDFEGKGDEDLSDDDRANRNRHEIHNEWAAQVLAGEERLIELNNRFGPWYYVISAESFENVRLTREDVTKEKAN